MVVVATNTPYRGGGGAQPALKRVPHRVPKPLEQSFRHVSRFGPHGLLIPIRCPTIITVRGGGPQVCLTLLKQVGDGTFSIPPPPAMGYSCVCTTTTGTVRHKAEVQSKSQRKALQ